MNTVKTDTQYKGNDFYCDMVFSGEIEVEKVFETDAVLVFHHTRPSYPVHIVVVPKTHILSLLELNKEHVLEILRVQQSCRRHC